MKALYIVVILLFVPSMSFASRVCSSIGGTCRYSCAVNESSALGYFVDCEERQLCCTRYAKPGDERKVRKGTISDTKEIPQKVKATSSGTSAKSILTGEAKGISIDGGGQILVCHPIKEVYANPETLLDCGGRSATLNDLYKRNYRLIQILRSEKILYYLEKK